MRNHPFIAAAKYYVESIVNDKFLCV